MEFHFIWWTTHKTQWDTFTFFSQPRKQTKKEHLKITTTADWVTHRVHVTVCTTPKLRLFVCLSFLFYFILFYFIIIIIWRREKKEHLQLRGISARVMSFLTRHAGKIYNAGQMDGNGDDGPVS
jgi:hypothetical protein